MAQEYIFFNSISGDRRRYTAQDLADYFGSVLSSGLLHTDDIPEMRVSVESGTMNTVVDEGKAIVKGHLYRNTTPHTLTHALPEPNADRIDRIVLRLDLRSSERNILLHVKEGTPSSNPTPPTLQRDDFIYELSLASVFIRRNTSSIDVTDITDERLDEDLCGLVYSLISIPTSQFLDEWNVFFDGITQEMLDDQQAFKDEWQAWFDSVQDASYITGDEFYTYKNKVDARIKIIQDVIIEGGEWSLDNTSNLYVYDIYDGDIKADSVVDVNIHLDDLIDAVDIKSANTSHEGFVRLYSDAIIPNNINADVKVIRQVV